MDVDRSNALRESRRGLEVLDLTVMELIRALQRFSHEGESLRDGRPCAEEEKVIVEVVEGVGVGGRESKVEDVDDELDGKRTRHDRRGRRYPSEVL
jgi:hypothetical protein